MPDTFHCVYPVHSALTLMLCLAEGCPLQLLSPAFQAQPLTRNWPIAVSSRTVQARRMSVHLPPTSLWIQPSMLPIIQHSHLTPSLILHSGQCSGSPIVCNLTSVSHSLCGRITIVICISRHKCALTCRFDDPMLLERYRMMQQPLFPYPPPAMLGAPGLHSLLPPGTRYPAELMAQSPLHFLPGAKLPEHLSPGSADRSVVTPSCEDSDDSQLDLHCSVLPYLQIQNRG